MHCKGNLVLLWPGCAIGHICAEIHTCGCYQKRIVCNFQRRLLDAWFSEVCNLLELRYAELRPRQLWLGHLLETLWRSVSENSVPHFRDLLMKAPLTAERLRATFVETGEEADWWWLHDGCSCTEDESEQVWRKSSAASPTELWKLFKALEVIPPVQCNTSASNPV